MRENSSKDLGLPSNKNQRSTRLWLNMYIMRATGNLCVTCSNQVLARLKPKSAVVRLLGNCQIYIYNTCSMHLPDISAGTGRILI